ncbi:hypothetical protein ONS96_014979 [Cadophora gregata f. sp. sojae]|nr:hypothetical protein ONS96_014979 [Cadophora gregata f. sp. sojae]
MHHDGLIDRFPVGFCRQIPYSTESGLGIPRASVKLCHCSSSGELLLQLGSCSLSSLDLISPESTTPPVFPPPKAVGRSGRYVPVSDQVSWIAASQEPLYWLLPCCFSKLFRAASGLKAWGLAAWLHGRLCKVMNEFRVEKFNFVKLPFGLQSEVHRQEHRLGSMYGRALVNVPRELDLSCPILQFISHRSFIKGCAWHKPTKIMTADRPNQQDTPIFSATYGRPGKGSSLTEELGTQTRIMFPESLITITLRKPYYRPSALVDVWPTCT